MLKDKNKSLLQKVSKLEEEDQSRNNERMKIQQKLEDSQKLVHSLQSENEQLHSKIIEYLDHKLFKIEENEFVGLEHWSSTKKKKVYREDIYYEEIKPERVVL